MTPHSMAHCILLADGSIGSALQAARSLHSHGVEVYIASTDSGSSIFRSSRACKGAVDLPTSDSSIYMRSLREWAKAHVLPGTIVLPLSDRTADWLDVHRTSPGAEFVLAIPRSEVLRPLLDKSQAMAIAERAGLDVLPWHRVAHESDLEAVTGLTFPLIVRPTAWDSPGADYFKQAVFSDAMSLRGFLADRLADGAVMIVQEFLAVDAESIEFAIVGRSQGGKILSLVTGRKRATSDADGGVMAWGESITLPDVADACEAFVASADYVGAGGIEMIRFEGRLWFVEFNPRPEAIHFLSDVAGVPHLWTVVADQLGLDVPNDLPTQQPAAIWMETAWLSQGNLGRSLLDLTSSYHSYRRHTHRAMAIFTRKDPMPALMYTLSLAQHGLNALRRRVQA